MWESKLITCSMLWGAWAVLAIVSFPLLTAWVINGQDAEAQEHWSRRERYEP